MFFMFLFLSNAFAASIPELKVTDHGKALKTISIGDMKALNTPHEVTVFEPHEMHDQKYTGFLVTDLLQQTYGDRWQKEDEVLFTCADGYQSAIPVSRFKEFTAYLVYERADDPSFSVTNKHQNNEHVPLGPFYLVWDNIKSPALKRSGAMNWPYQVVGMETISLKERFPHSFPNPKSGAGILAGFQVFRTKCMTCHKVNGDGGEKAPELNLPVSVTEYWKKEWLEKFIWDPRSVRAGSTMPGLKDMGTKEELRTVLSYLRKMKESRAAQGRQK